MVLNLKRNLKYKFSQLVLSNYQIFMKTKIIKKNNSQLSCLRLLLEDPNVCLTGVKKLRNNIPAVQISIVFIYMMMNLIDRVVCSLTNTSYLKKNKFYPSTLLNLFMMKKKNSS